MKRKRIAILVVVLIGVISTIIYLMMTGRIQTGEELDIKEKAKIIQQESQAIDEATKREAKLLTQFDPNNDSQVEGLDASYMNNFGSPQGMAEYVFGTLILNDPELFINAFDGYTISNDLSEGKNYEEKMDIVAKMMQRLSRDGTLKEVNLISSNVYDDGAEAQVLLIYEDEKDAKVKLKFSVDEEMHDPNHKKSYSVLTSIWDLIDQVEKQTAEE